MKFSINNEVFINLTNSFGHTWSVQERDLQKYQKHILNAAEEVRNIRSAGKGPAGELVLFPHLPYILDESLLMTDSERDKLDKLDILVKRQDAVISIGIGGSYLGNQALFDIFCGSYWNHFSSEERNGYPLIYFAGQNADSASITDLIRQLRRNFHQKKRKLKVLLLLISKSGSTMEFMLAFQILSQKLVDFCELSVVAITNQNKGQIHELAEKNQWTCFNMPEGIGGRFSIFSQVGLVFSKFIGLDIKKFLSGAKMVEESCRSEKWSENPALAMAAIKFIAMKEYGVSAEVIMPYGDKFRAVGWWYAQLLGESLGKKLDIHGNIVHNGRIPVSCVGTTDMHSLTQEHQQGRKNKLLQFISAQEQNKDMDVVCEESGKQGVIKLSKVLSAALHANEKALADDGRMSCHVSMRTVTPFHVGALMYFFFLATAYEGAMAGINSYDQPGVEDYKKILHSYLSECIEKV